MRHYEHFTFDDVQLVIQRLSRSGAVLFELLVELEGAYRPAVPPVPCHDPDHPAYSDPGSGAELDVQIRRVLEVDWYDPEGDELDYSTLSEDDQDLIMAICAERILIESWNTQLQAETAVLRRQQMLLAKRECVLHNRWLAELLAARHGVGPWNELELTDEELKQAEDGILGRDFGDN